MTTIVDYLEHWAAVQPDKCFSSFLDGQGKEIDTYTYLGFHERSRHLAEYLVRNGGIKRGDRVLLVYPPGLEIVVAFFACVRIGVVPVPVCPPTSSRHAGAWSKLAFVARDCEARAALTTRLLYQSYHQFLEQHRNTPLLQSALALPNLNWMTTDDVKGQASGEFRNDLSPLLFLQYTSGSTSDPKGVMVSHENVIHNCRAIIDHNKPTGVCWLPQYHDMGLIGYYIYPIISGGTTYGFSPMDFLKRPILWLQALSRFQATFGSSPNFGFEYCLREDKIPPDQLDNLDLSSVRVLMNASEPVRAETYSRFLERFAPFGLHPQASVVTYGLAESTLAVTHYGRRVLTVNKQFWRVGALYGENTQFLNHNQLRLMSCGRPLDGIHLRIVDPESRAILRDGQVGEIWLAGQSTCQGYWNRPELTREVFHNTVSNDSEDHNTYLRTGDLGFLDNGELFVCGRLKDLIIIRGVNYYPQDIESSVESASQKIRIRGVAAFSGNEKEETLVVVVEVRAVNDLPDPAEITRVIRAQHAIGPVTIVFVPARTISITTSGKIARSLTRQRWLSGELPVIAAHVITPEPEPTGVTSAGMMRQFQHLLEPYNVVGHEEYTLAEMGIDSITLVSLLNGIAKLLEEHGARDLANELDGRLLQCLTVAEFFSLLEQFEKVSDEAVSTVRAVLQQRKQEHDDRERQCMRFDTKLDAINLDATSRNDEQLKSVLLTGPTGFFGPFLLSSLLRQTTYDYCVLTRAINPTIGMDRIRNSLRRAQVWTPTLNEELEKRVHVICGDIAQHNLGLPADHWKSLSTQVQAVIHNAAAVNYILKYDALKPSNVDGTRELLRFACTGTPKEFHLISSTIIFGWTLKDELLETDNNTDMLDLEFGYAQSKWVAEQLVFAAEKQGLPVRIYRPAFISASTCGIASNNDIVIRLLAFMINHRIAPNAWNQISFLPADIAANNIVSIFKQRQIADRTFHVTVNDYYNFIDVTRLITQEYGYSFAYHDIPTFVAEMRRLCSKDDPMYPLLDFFSRFHPKIMAMQRKRYNNSRYRQAIRLSGNSASDPSLKETVSYLMEHMLQQGVIPRLCIASGSELTKLSL